MYLSEELRSGLFAGEGEEVRSFSALQEIENREPEIKEVSLLSLASSFNRDSEVYKKVRASGKRTLLGDILENPPTLSQQNPGEEASAEEKRLQVDHRGGATHETAQTLRHRALANLQPVSSSDGESSQVSTTVKPSDAPLLQRSTTAVVREEKACRSIFSVRNLTLFSVGTAVATGLGVAVGIPAMGAFTVGAGGISAMITAEVASSSCRRR